ncbi:exostosin-2 [Microplitis mediator]|uniref:exostosin-2 n=1 Tax=Microplitis mediator TaxID=375433 RepID=UPI002555EA39|nr:exostosin-2 [Microplitis mediator]
MISTHLMRKHHHHYHYHRNILLSIVVIVICVITLTIGYHLLGYVNTKKEIIYSPVRIDLDTLSSLPQVSIPRTPASPTNISCTHFTCFNVYRCGQQGSKLLVYVYPIKSYVDEDGAVINGQLSREFIQILDAVTRSKFYTPDPHQACLFVPSIDTLNQNKLNVRAVGRALSALEFWNNGENHLIFNLISGVFPDYNTSIDVDIGRAMLVAAGFSSSTYRSGFDLSIPVFASRPAGHGPGLGPGLESNPKLPKLDPRADFVGSTDESEVNKIKIISGQINLNIAFEQDLQDININNEILILHPCVNHNPMSDSMRCDNNGKVYKYPDVLGTGTFCLVIRGARLGQSIFLESLAAGCIPVVVSDSVVMPFSDIIDWRRAVVFIREVDILSLISTLKNISATRIEELRDHGQWLWSRYFKSVDLIVNTALEVMNDRIFPQLMRDYNSWNSRSNYSPLFLPVTAPKTHGFTAVILTYDRVELLFSLITKITQVPSLSKILVIWNNVKKDPPASSRWPKVNKSLQVIRTKENKLSNRFYPYDEIETEAVLSIDDDIIMLTADELEFAYEVWREFPDRIVGFPSRTHTWDNETQCWRYESEWTNVISMVLTGAAFHHKYWMYLYTTSMPGDIKWWVDSHMNCEDIAMNFLIANTTGKSPIKVTPKKKFRCPECTNTEMLSADLAHMAERTHCINRFTRIYGTMPLKSVEFRADPVLFKDVFPEKLKRFNAIKSL